jgi:hypothetical protein
VKPSLDGGVLKAKVSNQGYVAVANENVLFPSIGVTADGAAVMTFSLSGPDYFPSAAYAPLRDKAGNIRLAGPGVGPDDGFSGYAAEGGNGIGRWGDYSAAVADGDGNIWIAAEFIGQTCTDAVYAADSTCGGTRTLLANWGTFIGRLPSENEH